MSREKFEATFGPHPEVLAPDAGVAHKGFRMDILDLVKGRARFVSNFCLTSVPKEIFDFVKGAKIPEGTEEITVKRRRLINEPRKNLTLAEVEFPLKDGYMAQWRLYYEWQMGKRNPRVKLSFLAPLEIPLVLAQCEYSWDGDPFRISLTGRDLEQTKAHRAAILVPKYQHNFVPSDFILKSQIIEQGYTIEYQKEDMPCQVEFKQEKDGLTVVRINNTSGHRMHLRTPRCDYNDLITKLTGSWKGIIQLIHGVDFDFASSKTV